MGDGGRDLGDVADLVGQVAGHDVDVVGQVLPGAGDAGDLGLAAQLALGADLAGDAGHLVGEGAQLLDHGVHGLLEVEHLSAGGDLDLVGQVALGHGGGDPGHVAHLVGQVGRHGVHVVGQVLPGPADPAHDRLAAQLALGADLAREPGHLVGEGAQLVDHGVDRVLELLDLAARVDGDLAGQVALGHGGRDLGDAPHLRGQVAGHGVDVVGQVLPDPSHADHTGLAA